MWEELSPYGHGFAAGTLFGGFVLVQLLIAIGKLGTWAMAPSSVAGLASWVLFYSNEDRRGERP